MNLSWSGSQRRFSAVTVTGSGLLSHWFGFGPHPGPVVHGSLSRIACCKPIYIAIQPKAPPINPSHNTIIHYVSLAVQHKQWNRSLRAIHSSIVIRHHTSFINSFIRLFTNPFVHAFMHCLMDLFNSDFEWECMKLEYNWVRLTRNCPIVSEGQHVHACECLRMPPFIILCFDTSSKELGCQGSA